MLPDVERADKPGSIPNLFLEIFSDLLSDIFGSLLCEPQKWLPVTQSSGSHLQREEAIRGSPSHLCCGQ